MKYHIEQITIIRKKEDGSILTFGYKTDETTDNINAFGKHLKMKYNAKFIDLTYTEIPDEVQDS